MSAGAGAAAAGAAAAAAQAAARREEEELTPYTPQDIAENWEFKILRSTTGAFRNPDRLRAILEEEARAGWTLVEKFDDSRVRLKRPARARAGDADLGFDPRRTWVGIKPGVFTLLVMLGMVVVGLLIAVIIYLFASASH
jgi:hypothetical protein